MDNIYILMIAALAILAIADLVVGVSNDAVNFLNSAIGSKAVSFKTIMIVASLGVAFGALSSSGMMEVARKGIFMPSEFYFNEIMIIFMAVMITDILLLDFFNTLGMPTSTTVSIVFELLGAAVIMSLIKISTSDSQTIADLGQYINTAKATEIILGILLSVVVAFSIGAFVQYNTRLLLTFNFEQKAKWVSALFGGIAATAITYFILIKGLKGASFVSGDFKLFISENAMIIVALSFIFWTALCSLITAVFKMSVYKFIIIIGTFAIAMAFAGNDLVNFIGVPIAAWQSYEAWVASGVPATEFSMEVMSKKVPTPSLLLFLAGFVMVLTLWFSKKAKTVLKTSLDLSNQDSIKERFDSNFLSRGIVRFSTLISKYHGTILPKKLQDKIEKQFEKPKVLKLVDKHQELPAFDMVRASVNLMVASILISIATSMKLPLSTTYVTFMVAMGTSLADRAWGRESAVYRIAGVLNVIGGWFFTAFSAFAASGIIAYLIYLGETPMIAILLLITILLLARNYLSYKKKSNNTHLKDGLIKAESKTVQGIIQESANHISNVVSRTNKIYSNMLNGLATEDLSKLKKSRKGVEKLNKEVDELRDDIFYFIKNLDETSVLGSNFYIIILGYLQDVAQSLDFLAKTSYKHVNNNHKSLKFSQIKDLQDIDNLFESLLNEIEAIFNNREFEKLGDIINRKQKTQHDLALKITSQINRTRTEDDVSPKNTALHFSLLLETKDLVSAIMNLIEEYYNSYNTKN
ncbi:MAG: inorganic phosphate transporter [Flavobacteriaceae bacterium]|jgi:phosphate/sulfate permease|nr:inorganic phosphate transporter [Flavobacteriaceae bacterium]MBT6704814.1 inorganic phosphate transporter [Flavobacteriaceae bacterium]